ncbi:aldo/keto reductase [Ancylomarina sp. 16SWW S1-10-2]|uniref:aldo/keto reductase n=1 Tax=Ancylomarina sp. 16SWW S1-10-2 TaxID=2499681 RepID=UPI0012ADC05B|nr:aldo/keto reductase [Ancylomarina sp. 16SWW S1-10-2]MRT93209.1 aldo/keto reductase [Ancylomarina sp. 16SWW S1-10-2]
MKYRKLGNTDLTLSAITFGSFAIGGWLWGGTKQNEAIKAIQVSYDLGVTSIDTAPVYGQGFSEQIVGQAIKDIPRDKIQILTKFGMRWDSAKGTLIYKNQNNNGKAIDIYKYAGKESIIQECEASLKRLGTDYIDLYQLHWPDITTPIEETMDALNELIKQGKIRYAGVCNYNTEQFAEAEKYINLASNQVPYSMVLRDIEKEIVPYSLNNGKGVIAYSPLERGLLTGKMKPGYKFGEGDQRATRPFYKDENLSRTNEFLNKIKPIADSKGLSLGQLVILWTLQQPAISITLVGARNAEQAIQNAKATEASLTTEEIGIINEHLNQLVLVP